MPTLYWYLVISRNSEVLLIRPPSELRKLVLIAKRSCYREVLIAKRSCYREVLIAKRSCYWEVLIAKRSEQQIPNSFKLTIWTQKGNLNNEAVLLSRGLNSERVLYSVSSAYSQYYWNIMYFEIIHFVFILKIDYDKLGVCPTYW